MSERGQASARSTVPAVELLVRAVERLLHEDEVELPAPEALERLRTVLVCAERLRAAQLAAVRDMDSRQLYALDDAGSARGWLRRQPGGEDGQVTLARRLARRPLVGAALADGRIGLRSATQLCTALEHVPDDLDDALVAAVVQDGIGRLLRERTGGTPEDPESAAAVLARRAADTAVLSACCTDLTVAPAVRVEPAFVLLAERLAPGELGSALRLLLDPLQRDGTDSPAPDPYYLELRVLADGDVDIRGLLDPETGLSLAAEVERRLSAVRAAAAEGPRVGPGGPATAGSPSAVAAADGDSAKGSVAGGSAAGDAPTEGVTDTDPLLAWDRALADAETRAARRATQPGAEHGHAGPDAPLRLVSAGRRRHDALRDVLTDAASATPPGQAAPCHLTVIATLAAVEGRLGALPAQLSTVGGTAVPLPTATLQRLGCNSTLDAVLLDATGTPVGASSSRRMPTPRERRALRARWGAHCAIDGCHRTDTVPHHVEPWWRSHRTRLRDLVPLCGSCHHDLHEGHRTLRLRDQRVIDDHGWVTARTAAA